MFLEFISSVVFRYLPLGVFRRIPVTVRVAASRVPTGAATVFVALGCFVSNATAADVIAGWDVFRFASVNPPEVTDGITTGDHIRTEMNGENNPLPNRASLDGSWGTLDTPMSDQTNDETNDVVRAVNGLGGFVDFIVTDEGGADRDLTGFHFDTGTFRPNSAHLWELSVVSGDLTVGTVASGDAANVMGGTVDWYNYDIDLSVLEDRTLDANGTVTFRLEFTSDADPVGLPYPGHHQYLDNVAISTGEFDFSTPGDFDLDGDVDGADFLGLQRTDSSQIPTWETNYGAGLGALSVLATAVPEPTALVLFGLAISTVTVCGRRRG